MDKENNRILKNDNQMPNFIIDDSALKDIFEGKNKGSSNDLLMKIKEMNDRSMKVTVVTTLSAFLRAIYLSNPKVEINKIQKTLSFLQVIPSVANFKNGDEVRNEIMKFAHIMSGGKSKNGINTKRN